MTAALPADDRPVDPTPVHTVDLPPTPLRDRTIPADAWIEAPEELRRLGEDLGHDVVAYKRRIGPWLLWRAGPARRGHARYMAVHAHDLGRRHTFRLRPDGTGEGAGPDGATHTRFRTWKESLRDSVEGSAGVAPRLGGHRVTMAEIEVTEMEPGWYGVRVREGDTTTSHRVRVPDDLEAAGVPAGAADRLDLVHESFEFLLEREPATSILEEFELPVIARYFPEYPEEIARRLEP